MAVVGWWLVPRAENPATGGYSLVPTYTAGVTYGSVALIDDSQHQLFYELGRVTNNRGFLVRLVMCVMVGHRKLKVEIIKRLAILF